MGAWGTAIFSDDTAADVREDYRDLIGQGLSSEEATEKLIAEWQDSFKDPDEAPVIWLALAESQWKLGRLLPEVRQMALRIIADGSDLERWRHDAKLLAARSRHLDKLRLTLDTAQPAPRRVSPRFKDSCDWVPGEIVGYRMKSGTMVLFRTIGVNTDRGGDSPVCEVLDWSGAELPPEQLVLLLAVREHPYGDLGSYHQIMIGATSAREIPKARIFRTSIMSTPSRPRGRCVVTLWRQLDNTLAQVFGFA